MRLCVRQCARQCVAMLCGSVPHCGSVRQCTRQCAAARLVVYGSARGSVRLCTAVLQCAASAAVCGSIAVCGTAAVCGSAVVRQCALKISLNERLFGEGS